MVIRGDVHIGEWLVRPSQNRMTGPGGTVHLEPHVMQVLVCLAERPGEAVSRGVLLETVWAGAVISEHALTNSISELRKRFNDDPRRPRYIETIRQGGYRLIAPVEVMDPAPGAMPALLTCYQGDGAPFTPGPEFDPDPVPGGPGETPPWLWRLWGVALLVTVAVGVYQTIRPSTSTPPAIMSDPEVNVWRIPAVTPPDQVTVTVPVLLSRHTDQQPQVSSQGDRLAFISNRSGTPEVWVSNHDGSEPLRLTTLGQPATRWPRWSPDGRRLAFETQATGSADVYIVNARGGDPKPVATSPAHESRPHWSRDGRFLYIGSDRSGSWQLWKVSVETGEAQQVTQNGGVTGRETPDGAALIFTKQDPASLWTLSFDTEEEAPLEGVTNDGGHDGWTQTDTGVYFLRRGGYTSGFTVYRFAFDTRRVDAVVALPGNATTDFYTWGLAVSPDDQWIYYGQIDRNESDRRRAEPSE